MDYLCRKFDVVMVETKCVNEYYWKNAIKTLVQEKVSQIIHLVYENLTLKIEV